MKSKTPYLDVVWKLLHRPPEPPMFIPLNLVLSYRKMERYCNCNMCIQHIIASRDSTVRKWKKELEEHEANPPVMTGKENALLNEIFVTPS